MKPKSVEIDMIRPTENVKSKGSLKPSSNNRHVSLVKTDSPYTAEPSVLRYFRKVRPKSASHPDHYGLEYSYNTLGPPGRRFSLIPSFPDTDWELESCLKCSEETDKVDEKHDGMSGEHLRPLLSLWKIAREKRKSPEKGSVRQSIQRHCGCVVRTSRKTDLKFS